jgi:thymidylate synthase
MNRVSGRDLGEGLLGLRRLLYRNGYTIKTERWQGIEEPPVFIEILHADLVAKMSDDPETASALTKATQPWADEHFGERVSGIPYNPPPSHVRWLKDTDKYMGKDSEKAFSHSYPERMWCDRKKNGIRFKYGNLQDAVALLKKEPHTRQCYVPMWFPEDLTAAVKGERVPCTFGWHFLLRGQALHCSYHMRSCDVVRHLHNDLYFANRLCLWLIEESGIDACVGYLHFSSTSLHCFENDRYALKKLIGE